MSADSQTPAEAKQEDGQGLLMETAKVIIHALILAFLVRLFLFQPFNIPSGSMKDTLLVGDYLFVSKYSYGYSKYSFFGVDLFDGRILSGTPDRGDVVVFKLPTNNTDDYIKRVIGLPGDKIQMLDGQLYINGEAVEKKRVGSSSQRNFIGQTVEVPVYEETLPNGVSYRVLDEKRNGPGDNTYVYTVPPNSYFMMGDNRDNSTDSRDLRSVGYVPHENLIGEAQVIFFSARPDWSWWQVWSWPTTIRWSRFFDVVD